MNTDIKSQNVLSASHAKAIKLVFLLEKSSKLTLPKLESIGRLYWKFDRNEFLNLKLAQDDINLKNFTNYPISLCSLNNETQLAVIDYSNCNLFIFDRKFNLKRENLSIANQLSRAISRPGRIESDNHIRLYVMDKLTNFIFLVNLFKNTVSQLVPNLTFRDLCFYKNNLFAHDKVDSSSIRVFSASGCFLREFHLSHGEFALNKPITFTTGLKISNGLLSVLTNFNEIRIFDLKGKFIHNLQMNEHETSNTYCFIDKSFVYLNNLGELKFWSFDLDEFGNIVDKSIVSIKSSLKLMSDSNSMIYFNRKIVVCFPWKQKLTILK